MKDFVYHIRKSQSVICNINSNYIKQTNLNWNTAAKDNKLQLDYKVSKRKIPFGIIFSPRFLLRGILVKVGSRQVQFRILLREIILDPAEKTLG